MHVSTVHNQAAEWTSNAPHPAAAPAPAPSSTARAETSRARTARLVLANDEAARIPEFKRYTLSIHMVQDTNRIVVQVIDPETRQVVRTVPPEHVVAALGGGAEPGALVDQQV